MLLSVRPQGHQHPDVVIVADLEKKQAWTQLSRIGSHMENAAILRPYTGAHGRQHPNHGECVSNVTTAQTLLGLGLTTEHPFVQVTTTVQCSDVAYV